MENQIKQKETTAIDLARVFEIEELEERLEFGTWTLSAEGNSNGTATAKATWSSK
ncbi:hypothetical protein SAMN04488109_1228 [Chryseolinea serpens]|jgi:hypothetical protein|uniref:Uncharacterized protein n=1 Tax=Chryseolinea serpens TaxID=947013 RepID=A0A1M5LJC8_9BACT|nr:hypothetical protein [Chryseolinea serpens]SHG64769.1 hypothetical protein SAMN04488109_1228 [Chryseolinea serpens]